MKMLRNIHISTRIVLMAAFVASLASADTALSVTNGNSNTPMGWCLGANGCFSQVLMEGWTSLNAYDNVVISAEVGGDDSSALLTAYLTNAIGAGATSANQLATVTLTPPSLDSSVLLFSGLHLSAGTYYLVMTGPAQASSFPYWYSYDTANVVTASGVTFTGTGFANIIDGASTPNTTYAPASVFDTQGAPNFSISVTGTLSTQLVIPEPASGIQMSIAAGILGIMLVRFRARKAAFSAPSSN
jgi:hypothetical protein